MAQVKIYRDRCIGAGICVAECPEMFDQSDVDGTVVVLSDEIPGELLGKVEYAAESCPSETIEVVRD
mgnify:CR=1 FL=1